MRTDEYGNECPETLGEYLAICQMFPQSRAVQFLENKTAEQGENMKVIAHDSQMRMLLMPMMLEPRI
jgi:hypothetical protein